MSGGVEVDVPGKRIVFTKDGRQVSTTDGALVNLLPTVYSDTVDAVFPDVPKGRMNIHVWDLVSRGSGKADGFEISMAHVTALPQEWSSETNLVAVPADVDFFAGRVRLTRTVAPSHMWLYNFSDLPPMVKTGVWIPLTGSFLLEQSVGIARALSIYVEGGYLKLHQQQTVGPAPGGWGPHSHNYGEPGQFHSGTLESMFPTHAQGGETLYYDGPAGWPLWYGGDTAPYRVVATYTAGGGYFTAEGDGYFRGISAGHFSWPGYQRLSQTLFAVTRGTTTDPTNMGSTWQVEIVGKFGRRS